MNLKNRILSNLSNVPGWSTSRKIVVLESDDWGSVRMSSKENRDALLKQGFSFTKQSFDMYDALESNDDISALYEVLRKHTDSTDRHPVFTAVSIVANPNFEKIKADKFRNYYYEPFTETLKRYPNHDQVIELYQKGIEERLFYPVFHGREHLNVQSWMKVLQNSNQWVLKTFDYGITGVSRGPKNEHLGNFQAAFDLKTPEDLPYMKSILTEGLDLFEELWNYKSTYFVSPNGPFNNSLEEILHKKNIKYVLGERLQNEPLGNGKYKKNFRYIGMKNKYGQTYLTRNGAFEPSVFHNNLNIEPIEKCMKNIERAFRWRKPAVISTHRLNYIGGIEEQNRKNGLQLLDNLLGKIISQWPDVEFMTSNELGNLIIGKNNE